MNRQIVLVELNFQITPMEVREQVSGSRDIIRQQLIEKLEGHVFVMSTCHRFCVLAWTCSADAITEVLQNLFPTLQTGHLLVLAGKPASRHWFSTACGLNSRTVGEHEIMGQIRHAYADCHKMPAALNELVKRAVHTGRRARTETAIGRYATSLTSITKDLITRNFDTVADRKVMIFGTGEMSRLILQMLGQLTFDTIYVVSKDRERALGTCTRRNMIPVTYEEVHTLFADCQILIGATWAENYLVQADESLSHLDRKLFIDLGMPRNFDPALSEFEGTEVFDLNSIHATADDSRKKRMSETGSVKRIIDEENEDFHKWLTFRDYVPEINSLRAEIEDLRDRTITRVEETFDHLNAKELEKAKYIIRGMAQEHFSEIIGVLRSDMDNLEKVTRKLEILHSFHLRMDGLGLKTLRYRHAKPSPQAILI